MLTHTTTILNAVCNSPLYSIIPILFVSSYLYLWLLEWCPVWLSWDYWTSSFGRSRIASWIFFNGCFYFCTMYLHRLSRSYMWFLWSKQRYPILSCQHNAGIVWVIPPDFHYLWDWSEDIYIVWNWLSSTRTPGCERERHPFCCVSLFILWLRFDTKIHYRMESVWVSYFPWWIIIIQQNSNN